MAQKFHSVRNGKADKETLEVCFAIDSDEEPVVFDEDDNTEERTTEDEVPPQVCKKTAKKTHVKTVSGFKRNTSLTVFTKRLHRRMGESNQAFLARGRTEYAALSPVEKKKLATEAASHVLPETLEEKREYLKQLVRQLHKVERVLAHIGATYYVEICFENTNHTLAHDCTPRHVLTKTPLHAPLSNITYLRKCVQKVLNDAYAKALGKEQCDFTFPYKKHFLAPVVKITGMPEGIDFKHPSSYGVPKLKQIIANQANIKMELITPSFVAEDPASEVVQTTLVQDIVAEDPSLCAAEVIQTPVVADIFVAEDPASEVVQTTLVQDIFMAEKPALEVVQTPVVANIFMAEDPASEEVQTTLVQDIVVEDPSLCAAEVIQTPVVADIFVAENPASEVVQTTLVHNVQETPTSSLQPSTVNDSAKQHRKSRGEKQRAGLRTLWTAAEVLVVQQHFSQELAGLKPVTRSRIESFLAQRTTVKRTSNALGNYLLRNRKKNRPDDQ